MKVLLDVIILVAGFIFLLKGADIFVDGSSALARVFNVPSLVIGLTIVALGTSAPELTVSSIAAFQKSNEIAISNVIGSNSFNLLVVLGACALLCPLPLDKKVLKRDFPISILATMLLIVYVIVTFKKDVDIYTASMSEYVGVINLVGGIILIILFISYILLLIYDSKNSRIEEEKIEKKTLPQCFLLILVGLIMIIGGGEAVVYSAKNIARAAGMTETLIGLTIVAIGTSIPELATSLVASRKGDTGLAIGNVVGSNIFNLLFILGVSSIIDPIDVNLASFIDLIILTSVSILTYIFCITKRKIARNEGIIMLSIYIGYMIFAAVR